jgi:hypothetical protein
MLLVLDSVSPDELELDQLQQLLSVRYPIEHAAEVRQCLLMTDASKGGKCIPLAGRVALGLKEGRDEVRCVGNECRRVLEDGCDSEDSVLAYICVAVFETLPGRGEERLDKLGFAKLAEETEGVTPDILVRMLKVIPDTIAEGVYVSMPTHQTRAPSTNATYQTRIISCFSFPWASSLGHIS